MTEAAWWTRALRVSRAGAGVAAVAVAMLAVGAVQAEDAPPPKAVPRAECGPRPGSELAPGTKQETGRQGRVSPGDYGDGKNFACNVEVLGHLGPAGGLKVLRYVDRQGQECAFYDTTLLFPTDVFDNFTSGQDPAGVFVLDMSDPTNPTHVTTLVTPAMLSPHESLVLNEKRGLLAAVMGNPTAYPGIIDIYDVTEDCLHPTLLSSTPIGLLGHESGFSPDGNTLYASSLITGNVTAVDVSNPVVPVLLWTGEFSSHGVSVSDDGNRVYFSSLHVDGSAFTRFGLDPGLVILDSTDIQNRVLPPAPTIVSKFRWEPRSTPQIAIPVTFGGEPHLIEVDEFVGVGIPEPDSLPGAARIIDITDEKNPTLVSDIRLEVHQAENRDAEQTSDPGANSPVGGYSGHYCSVPTSTDPEILACSFILSGLRVFDITDPPNPREVAYFNPIAGGQTFSMSAPAFVPERSEIWFTDGNKGFYALRLTNGVWKPPGEASAGAAPKVAPERLPTSTEEAASPGPQPGLPSTAGSTTGGGGIPLASTGGVIAAALAALAAGLGLVLRRL